MAGVAVVVAGCGAGAKPTSGTDGGAGLVFTRQSGEVPGVWLADADGSGQRQIVANGWGDMLSPDGREVTYSIPNGDDGWTSHVKNVVRGDPRPLGKVNVLAWSPDSKSLAVRNDTGLQLVEAASGKTRDLASGAVGQASFSPDGKAIAFSRHNEKEAPAWRSDIFVIRLSDDSELRVTNDGYSDQPVWGSDWLAFRRVHYEGSWPVGALFLLRPDGGGARQLATRQESPVPTYLGLDAIGFSKDGTKLLGCAAWEFHCSPVTFSIPSGEAHDLTVETEAVTQAQDFSDDGSEVLVTAGAFDGPPRDLYAIPFEGGPPRLLVKNVSSARWAG